MMVDLVADDEGDDLADDERRALHEALSGSSIRRTPLPGRVSRRAAEGQHHRPNGEQQGAKGNLPDRGPVGSVSRRHQLRQGEAGQTR